METNCDILTLLPVGSSQPATAALVASFSLEYKKNKADLKTRLDDPCLCDSLKDSKTELQEFLQANKLALPEYTLTSIEGDEHDQVFHVTCHVSSMNQETQGQGSNRRRAEQLAAKTMLGLLRK